MNCASFKDQLLEFAEGSLPDAAHAVAEEHLAGCEACREAVRREERLARVLSDGLRARVAGMGLNSEVKRRIRSRVVEKPKLWGGRFEDWQIRWALGAAVTALIVAGIYLVGGDDRREVGPKMIAKTLEGTQVHFAYEVPVQVFHREGNLVVDAFAYQEVAVNEMLVRENRN